jgi:hypothetical protein
MKNFTFKLLIKFIRIIWSGNLLEVKDNVPKIVVFMDEFIGKNTYQGIKHLYIKDFLLKFDVVNKI